MLTFRSALVYLALFQVRADIIPWRTCVRARARC
jgi:hypothetical protein